MAAVIKPEVMAEDSDDEDLEALRLAALQSIKNKPTVVTPRRRPKPVGRPNRSRPRNFSRGCVNTNLISIVPLELPLDKVEAADPPPLVLPQDRYCKSESKMETDEKETSVPSKFSRFEDSNSGDSEEDLEEDYEEQSSEGDKLCEVTDITEKVDDNSIADDDELLLQDEDSLGKFFNEFEIEPDEIETEKLEAASVNNITVKNDSSRSTSKPSASAEKEKSLDSCVTLSKGVIVERSSSRKSSDSKSGVLGKRPYETYDSKQMNKCDKVGSKVYLKDSSPSEESKRINRPCILGRNRSPSPLSKGKQFDKFQPYSKRIGRRNPESPKRKPSPPSPGSLSPLCKREVSHHKAQVDSGKSSLVARVSPRENTPPSHWGSRSDSSHGYSHTSTHQEWSSSPLKWPGSTVQNLLVESPKNPSSKSISPSRLSRKSKSPIPRNSRIWGSSERDWSGSPQQRRCRDLDTPPDSIRSTSDGLKPVRRRSTSPVAAHRVGERMRQVIDRSNRSAVIEFRSRRASPPKNSLHSPSKLPRRSSPVRSSSRTPSLSPSPEPQGKLSVGSYRRYKSPLRLPGYRPLNRDNRAFRTDGKNSRKDNDRPRTVRLNGPFRKAPDGKIEACAVRNYNSRLEIKVDEVSPQRKGEGGKDTVKNKSPSSAILPSSWSSDEGVQSDSESRFKGIDSKSTEPIILPSSKLASTAVLKVKELEETSPVEKKSPKRKKNKRNKKSLNREKVKDSDLEESKEKRTSDVDLRAELCRRRAERGIKSKEIHPTMPVRLLQSAFQGLTSKSNSVDGEKNTLKALSTKNDTCSDTIIVKKKPIHLRLGLPVARNPDPPEQKLSANSMLPRISGCEKNESFEPTVDGGNKWRKVKLKRSVTVQKSLPRGTSSTSTTASGKEQV